MKKIMIMLLSVVMVSSISAADYTASEQVGGKAISASASLYGPGIPERGALKNATREYTGNNTILKSVFKDLQPGQYTYLFEYRTTEGGLQTDRKTFEITAPRPQPTPARSTTNYSDLGLMGSGKLMDKANRANDVALTRIKQYVK